MLLFQFIFSFIYSILIQPETAAMIVKKADDKMKGETSIAQVIIKTVRPSWSREMIAKIWAKGNTMAMILIQSPVKEKGISYLKRQKEVWTWMPALEKTIKLPPSMMSQSWMGTDFTNDDLVKESSVVDDYIHSIIGDTIIDNRTCYRIEMIPKPEAAVVWSRLVSCIDKKDYLQLKVDFFDDDNKLVNTLNAFDIKLMDNRIIPTRFEMLPADKKNQKTIMIYKSIEYNRRIEDAFFTTERMKYQE